jgi:peptidoglycan/xylan/chitin deacetylase (PgdA/CDA1 family)
MSNRQTETTAPLDVCITVDMEPDCPPFLWTWRGMEEGAPRLLDLFAEEGIATTCFTTGDSARHSPDVAERIVADGHELGCHGMTHRPFPGLDRDAARREIDESARELRAFGPVISFRAPNLMFPAEYLSLLEEAGFALDSSQAKYKSAKVSPDGPTRLTRIPASVTSSVLRLPWWIRDRWLSGLEGPVVLFCHPWEFVDFRSTNLRLDCRFRTGEPALSDMKAVIRLFKAKGARFLPMRDLIPAGAGA